MEMEGSLGLALVRYALIVAAMGIIALVPIYGAFLLVRRLVGGGR